MNEKAITPFQRRLENWEITHVRQTISSVGGKISSVGDKIAGSIREHQKNLAKAANNILVSQERIASGIEEISFGVDNLSEGLEGLAAAFDWGFSEIVWQLEQERELLLDIKKILEAPLDTQAKELRIRAEDAYKNGWMEDAFEDFLESEKKNRYDFIVHQYIGNIYFFENKNPEKALSYYEKALKYSKPKSPYHASIALLHIGLIKYLQANFQKAFEATQQAIELTPNLWEAHYQHAQYCSLLGRYDDAIKYLENAFEGDHFYLIKANLEKDFDVMKKQLFELFESIRKKIKLIAQKGIDKAQEFIKYAEANDATMYTPSSEVLISAKDNLKKAKTFFEWNSIIDYVPSYYHARLCQEDAIESSLKALSLQISDVENEYAIKSKKNKEGKERLLYSSFWICIGTFITSAIIFKGCTNAFGLTGLVFLIILIYSKTPFLKKESFEEKLNNLKDKLSQSKEMQSQLRQ